MKKTNIPAWQRALLSLAPEWTIKRLMAMRAAERFFANERTYQGAGGGRRNDGWRGGSAGPNQELRPALVNLRNRSRELVRNNPYARRVLDVIPANVVGTGIQARPIVNGTQPYNRIKKAWTDWAESTACDWNERTDFYGLQSLIMRSVVESGECLIVRRWQNTDGNRAPLALQVLESDYLDQTRDFMAPYNQDAQVVQGIEFRNGKRIGYWLYNTHPGELNAYAVSSFVPASDVLHVYRLDRPGQVRGVPWLAPVMLRLNDFDLYEDAQLQRQMIAACFAGFIQDAQPDLSGISSRTTAAGTTQLVDKIEPGMMEVLPPGKTITFANPPQMEGYGEYTKTVLRGIATGVGISYEMLTGDMSMVNFSSGRMGWIEARRQVTSWQWQIMVNQVCEPVWRWFMEAASLTNVPVNVNARWTPPRQEMIDPVKETNALRDQVRNGFISLSEAIQQLGGDPEAVLPELESDLGKLDSMGLILDSDPRQPAGGGRSQPPDAAQDGSQLQA